MPVGGDQVCSASFWGCTRDEWRFEPERGGSDVQHGGRLSLTQLTMG